MLLLLDTGGVRLQEANAGELAISEIINAIIAARLAGVAVVALIGGRSGAFGGGGIVTACCSRIVVSEHARVGVSGPEVIETNKGVEEFDSKDRALVWRITGGRTRVPYRRRGSLCTRSDQGFPRQPRSLSSRPLRHFRLATLEAEQRRLADRLQTIWRLPRRAGDLAQGRFAGA